MDKPFLFSIRKHDSDYSFYKKNSYKLIYVKRGSLLCRFNSKENIFIKNTVLFANNKTDIFIKQSDEAHAIYIVFTKPFLDQISSIHNRIIFDFFYNSNLENNPDSVIKTIFLNENNINHVSTTINILIKEFKEKEPAYMSVIQAKFMELLIYFYRISRSNFSNTGRR